MILCTHCQLNWPKKNVEEQRERSSNVKYIHLGIWLGLYVVVLSLHVRAFDMSAEYSLLLGNKEKKNHG